VWMIAPDGSLLWSWLLSDAHRSGTIVGVTFSGDRLAVAWVENPNAGRGGVVVIEKNGNVIAEWSTAGVAYDVLVAASAESILIHAPPSGSILWDATKRRERTIDLGGSPLVMSLRGETAFSITATGDGEARHLDLWASTVGARPRQVGAIDLAIPIVDAGDGQFASFSDGRHERAWEMRGATRDVVEVQ